MSAPRFSQRQQKKAPATTAKTKKLISRCGARCLSLVLSPGARFFCCRCGGTFCFCCRCGPRSFFLFSLRFPVSSNSTSKRNDSKRKHAGACSDSNTKKSRPRNDSNKKKTCPGGRSQKTKTRPRNDSKKQEHSYRSYRLGSLGVYRA